MTRLIELRNVDKVYLDGGVRALDSVNLTIDTGEFVSIMGPSGCGKSTLLNMLGALDVPSEGEVRFEGQTLNSASDLDGLRAQKIGLVFQSFYLLPNLTALENVQLPMFEGERPLGERESAAADLLNLVGLSERKGHLPGQLSIGQRQRVAIARALANQPSVVLADEPTGSLDSASGSEVMDLLSRLNTEQGTTLVVVTHDDTVAQRAKRRINMLDGRILEDRVTSGESVTT